ncbi:sn-glycerol 3-phosphate transport system substrate-binding protein [Oceanisphaera litoralis]|uniref:sn-glycerol-3-phosphate ABC transporter substrate-binding protein UgpB n=1 Tax=Oceanisphaera litoralis TaxID=225144 RepID=UPI00195A1A94|nr:sn-glycerol-3-phosphate ABC transporter substrate-binding protein UgpB [Oceanisphaera litoralis]MBM7456418.1 sn-glycerol 3-phosphate transport system substrate-binding protein [Oceanisphaera litoralis]
MTFKGISLAITGLLLSTQVHATTQIQWWHAMGGELGDKVGDIADKFNQSQSNYEIKPVYKGSYGETMTGAIAAFRARQQPHIVQVFEVGTATMMAADRAIYPVYRLMAEAGQAFDQSEYLSAVTGYYTDNAGNMLSMPFNSSTPVLYYNKDLLDKAGVEVPTTWEEMDTVGRRLQESGTQCAFTTSWQSWIQLENFGALHDIPFATQNNGFSGSEVELLLDRPEYRRHIQQLVEWSQNGVFKYGGRQSDSLPLFYSGECAMFMGSSASYAGVKKNTPDFEFGVGKLPYWQAIKAQPQNSIIGGASLWVLEGHKQEEYQGVAEFFTFLASPEIQADWHQFTGYLPITHAAHELTRSQGFYQQNPGTEVAITQITQAEPTVNSKGVRLGNFVQIRDIVDEELEKVWADKSQPEAAIGTIVERANGQLSRFARAN